MAFGSTKTKDDITKTQAPQQMGPTENKNVTTLRPGGPPAALAAKIAADSGKGVSTDQADNQVPLIYVLQPLSPQVDKRDPRYVEGAEAGDIWLRSSPNPIVKGDVGVLFQPCSFWHDVGEWIPRDDGGGFVARHKTMPASAKKTEDPRNPQLVKYRSPDGNELVETRNHAGYALTEDGPLPYVLPLTSTGHSASRAWMFMMNSQRGPDGAKPPSWACVYRLKTVQKKNKKGSWFVLVAENGGDHGQTRWVDTVEDYERGSALYEAFASGQKQAEAPVADTSAAPDDDTIPF